MKKIKYILLATSLSAFTLSCGDSFLDDPLNSELLLDDSTIKTRYDLETAVNGLYSVMNSATVFGANHFTYQELTGDLGFVGVVNSGRFYTTNGWGHLSPDDGASGGIWNNLYNIIANANFVLQFEGKITDDELGEQSVKQLFAHAYAVRAYCYTVLMQYFAPNFGEGDQSLGVPLAIKYDINQRLPRSTVSEVYNLINADLTKARTGIEGSGAGRNTFNPSAINLLTARAYLFQKNYAKAVEFADLVLEDGGSDLLPRTGVSSYWTATGESSTETLFQIYETNNVNLGSNESIYSTWSSVGTYKQNFMARAFWDTFPSTDIRKTTFYQSNAYVNGLNDSPKPIDVRKYTTVARDVVQFRKTEAVFIKAEALYHTNPTLAASTLGTWVKTYRDTAYVVPVTSGDALLNEILRQKGFEFFLEGHRFSDLKRNNKSVIKYQTGSDGAPLISVPANDYRFIWPIPRSEVQTNPNMIQNPGYPN